MGIHLLGDEYICNRQQCGYQGPTGREIRESVLRDIPSLSRGVGCVCAPALIVTLAILGALLFSSEPSLGWIGLLAGGGLGALIVYGVKQLNTCPACETGALERVNSARGQEFLKRNRTT